jgi:hypothetical protein
MAIYGDFMDIHGDLVGAKVVPQFVNAKLVQISPISLGLMNGGYIYSIHGDYKPTNITMGAPPCKWIIPCLDGRTNPSG